MKINTIAVSLLLAVGMAGAGRAETPPDVQKPAATDAPKIDFVTVDEDANGSLSKSEVLPVAALDAVLEQLDTNRDEALSPAEFALWDQAGEAAVAKPVDPATAPSGSAGAQHMPDPE
jgi:hypothetical protein